MKLQLQKRKKYKRTHLGKKRDKQPIGHELYHDDPISQIPKIGKKREEALKKCGIHTILNYLKNPEKVHLITTGKDAIVKTIQQGLAKGVNEGKCPVHFDKIDHRKHPNPYESKYGAEWQKKISKTRTMKLVCPVSEIVQHMAQHTSDALKGTTHEGKALFYHDALSQLTEKKH